MLPRPPSPTTRASMAPVGAPPAVPRRPLRLLCLHGFRTSGAIMKEQLEISRLDRDLSDLAELVCVDAPHLATGPVPADVPWPAPHYQWWDAIEVKDDDEGESGEGGDGGRADDETKTKRKERKWVYVGFEKTLQYVSSVIEEQGPFDGFLAFSQGTILASLLLAAWSRADEERERERRASGGGKGDELARRRSSSSSSCSSSSSPLVLPPRLASLKPTQRPRFAVMVSGVWAKAPICSALEREEDDGSEGNVRWTRRESDGGGGGGESGSKGGGCIRSPSLHVIGARDYVSPLSRRLASAFRGAVVVEHPGGHVIPRLPPDGVSKVRAFLEAQAAAPSL